MSTRHFEAKLACAELPTLLAVVSSRCPLKLVSAETSVFSLANWWHHERVLNKRSPIEIHQIQYSIIRARVFPLVFVLAMKYCLLSKVPTGCGWAPCPVLNRLTVRSFFLLFQGGAPVSDWQRDTHNPLHCLPVWISILIKRQQGSLKPRFLLLFVSPSIETNSKHQTVTLSEKFYGLVVDDI